MNGAMTSIYKEAGRVAAIIASELGMNSEVTISTREAIDHESVVTVECRKGDMEIIIRIMDDKHICVYAAGDGKYYRMDEEFKRKADMPKKLVSLLRMMR